MNNPIAVINARHSSAKAKLISPQQLFGLHPTLLLCKGAKVILTMNLWSSAGLCNGASGTVVDIVYAHNQSPPNLPIAVVVEFNYYTGPSFFNKKSCVPIPPVTATINIDNCTYERQQLPLTLAWALTIHKSQGMTMENAWVDIGKKETTVSMTYVALSRVRNLSSLVIEPFTFDRLSCIKELESLKYRIKEETRLQEIANNTTLDL